MQKVEGSSPFIRSEKRPRRSGAFSVRPGFKPFQVRANSGNLTNRTDVFATTASTNGP